MGFTLFVAIESIEGFPLFAFNHAITRKHPTAPLAFREMRRKILRQPYDGISVRAPHVGDADKWDPGRLAISRVISKLA